MDDVSSTFDTRVAQYVALRDRIKEIKDRHSSELEPYIEIQNKLTAWFIERLDAADAKSVRTNSGTVYSSSKYTASLSDPKAFMDYVIANEKFDLLDRRANSTAVRDFVEQNGSEPPGAKLSAIRTIGVRRASDKTSDEQTE